MSSGGKRDGAGRKRRRVTLQDHYVMERQTIGALNPFHPLEMWEFKEFDRENHGITFQSGDDIIVLRLPDG